MVDPEASVTPRHLHLEDVKAAKLAEEIERGKDNFAFGNATFLDSTPMPFFSGAGLVQQTVQIVASHDLTLFVMHELFLSEYIEGSHVIPDPFLCVQFLDLLLVVGTRAS